MTTVTASAPTKPVRPELAVPIHDAVLDAIDIVRQDGSVITIMPADVFPAYGLDEDTPWDAENGLDILREVLFAHLGCVRIKKGEEDGYMRRYRHIEPHEFESPHNSEVSTYVTYVHRGGSPSCLVYEIGPAGGYPANEESLA